MNKKIFFVIFNLLIIVSILSFNNFLLFYFGKNYLYIYILSIIISVIFYFILSKSFIDDIFVINNRLKDKIEKTMHEINTPVATISINTEILRLKMQNSKNIKRLNRIDEACDNLLKLYENMEYFLKKEIDNVEIVDFELKKFLNIAILKFNDLKGNIQIIINTPPITITTDKSGFELVIDNLISNSIKHNKKINTINIDLQNDILIFRDDGEGIDTKIIYKVFNRYFQNSDTSKGFGIGLNIVKEFCDKHKIDIKIETSSNGTLFKLNLKNIIKGR